MSKKRKAEPGIAIALGLLMVASILPAPAMAAQNPGPDLTGISVPSSVTTGDTFLVEVDAENDGGDAPVGQITISFPDNPQILHADGTGDDYNELYPAGSTIWHKNGYQFTSDYHMVELGQSPWDSGNSETLGGGSGCGQR